MTRRYNMTFRFLAVPLILIATLTGRAVVTTKPAKVVTTESAKAVVTKPVKKDKSVVKAAPQVKKVNDRAAVISQRKGKSISPVRKKNHPQVVQKEKVSQRKLLSAADESPEEAEFLSKEELLGKDYGTPPDLTEVKKEINSYLKKIANLCQVKPLESQINQLEKSLVALRKIIPVNLENQFLTIKDHVFLARVYNTVAKKGILTAEKKIKVQDFKKGRSHLAENFLHHYTVRYNLEEEGEPKFYREWEKNIYEGLKCMTTFNVNI